MLFLELDKVAMNLYTDILLKKKCISKEGSCYAYGINLMSYFLIHGKFVAVVDNDNDTITSFNSIHSSVKISDKK